MQSHLEQCRQNMVEHQVRPWDVLDDKVLNILEQVPRDQFVPEKYQNLAYADTAIPLNSQVTMMHPVVEGRILQAVNIQPEDNILEIGTGSGYLTACLASLGSHVDSVEIDESLATQAQESLQQLGINNINITTGNGLDVDTGKLYDVIVLTGSVSEIPEELKRSLNDNGRLFVVSGDAPAMQAHLVTRTADDSWADESLFETVQPRLQFGDLPAQFNF